MKQTWYQYLRCYGKLLLKMIINGNFEKLSRISYVTFFHGHFCSLLSYFRLWNETQYISLTILQRTKLINQTFEISNGKVVEGIRMTDSKSSEFSLHKDISSNFQVWKLCGNHQKLCGSWAFPQIFYILYSVCKRSYIQK